MTILVLDGDEISYSIAAACEERGIRVTNTNSNGVATFKTRTKMKEFLKGVEIPEDLYTIEDTQIAEPLANALSTVKSKLVNLKEKFETEYVEIYLSGDNNFRLQLPLPDQYKSGRKDTIRPLLLNEIKEYLVKYHKAVVVDGDEADAALTTRMWYGYKNNMKIIASTIDKDARGSAGWLYNPDKDELLYIDGYGDLYLNDTGDVKGHGRVWFYYQLLIGDWSTDTYDPRRIVKAITGKLPKWGEKTCYEYLSKATYDGEAWKLIHDKYLEWFGADEFSYTAWDGSIFTGNYLDALQMIADCAHMARWKGDRLDVRSVLTKMNVLN